MNVERAEKLQAFLDSDPGDSFSRFALALEYLKLDDLQTARSHFEFIRDNDPDYIGVYYHLGKLYERIDEPEYAMKTYITGISIARKTQDHHAASELEQAQNELNTDDI